MLDEGSKRGSSEARWDMASGRRREQFQKTASSGHMLTLDEAIVTNAREMVGRCSGVGRDAFMWLLVGWWWVVGSQARDGVEARTV